MIDLPDLPLVFTTRQIECISCREHFSIAEEFITANQQTDQHEEVQPPWRLPPDHHPNTQLRFHETRFLRSIIPQTRAEPNPGSLRPFLERNNDTYVNCPRCGADNRNWLQITNLPRGRSVLYKMTGVRVSALHLLITAIVLVVLSVVFIAILGITLGRDVSFAFVPPVAALTILFILAATITAFSDRLFKRVDNGGLVTFGTFASQILALAAFLLYASVHADRVLSHAVPLGVVTFLAGLIPALFISDEWRRVLDSRRLRRFLPQVPQRDRFPIALRIGLISFIIFAFVLPLAVYWLFPLGLSFFFDRIDPEPRLTPQQSIEALQTSIEEWRSQSDSPEAADESLEELLRASEEFLTSLPAALSQVESVEGIIRELEAQDPNIPEELRGIVQDTTDNLSQYVDENRSLLSAEPEPSVPFEFPRAFLFLWIAFVGTSSLTVTLLSAWALEIFVARVDAQVPPPIFHSVANMTRVVVWEAKHALEIRGNMEHVQWMDVRRNDLGGIDLSGLHRDLPTFDAEGTVTSDRVRAQRYAISTDRFGRIVQARIGDVNVPYAVGSPGFVVQRTMPQFVASPNHSQR